MLARVVEGARRALAVRAHHGRTPGGVPLPPLPFRMGGAHFRRDEDFIAAALRDARRLGDTVGLCASSRMLDWGCGAGRLAIGVAEEFGRIAQYDGVDVQRHLIAWAARHLGTRPGFRFTHVDVASARYNPDGAPAHSIPGASSDYDVFHAYSVFSHLRAAEARAYMKEIARLLRPGGAAFITAFVEEDVPDEEENPVGYGPLTWQGPLHCVRFERRFFEDIVNDAGLHVESFAHGGETDGQSLFVLRKPATA